MWRQGIQHVVQWVHVKAEHQKEVATVTQCVISSKTAVKI